MALRCFAMQLRTKNSWASIARPWLRSMSSEPTPSEKQIPDDANVLKSAKYKPTDMERRFFVWVKKYKTLEEVPTYVTYDQMERTRNLIRIYGTTLMMFLTLIGSYAMIRSGRSAKARGESLGKANLEWHKAHKEAAEK